MKKTQIELLEKPVEIRVLRDGRSVMNQVFQHTPIRFGRILDNDVVLPFDGVSRHHCELHFTAGEWRIEDLKSLNGVHVGGERVTNAALNAVDEFEVKPVIVQMRIVQPTTSPGDESTGAAVSGPEETLIGTSPQMAEAQRLHDEKNRPARFHQQTASFHAPPGKGPLLEVNAHSMMGEIHPHAEKIKSRAIQISVMWHEVLLSVDEFLPGEDLIVEINGFFLRLGRAGQERSEIRCATGTTFLDRPGRESVLLPNAPATWMADDGIQILARYAPPSRTRSKGFIPLIESDLVDPLVVSGVVHGALALATLTMTTKTTPPKDPVNTERIAKIIVNTPLRMAAAAPLANPPSVSPTTTPTPPVASTPPPSIVKATPRPVPTPPSRPQRAQIMAVKSKPPSKVERLTTKATPKPFNAASVGALRALSALSTMPAPQETKTERIVIRKTANARDGGGTSAISTAQMMKALPTTPHASRDAVAGLSAPVSQDRGYETSGFSGKTGKRDVLGSVIGGATYTPRAKTDGLTREQVMSVVQKHHTQIQRCYEQELARNPGLGGRAEFEWEITGKGAVIDASIIVKETNLKNGERLISCVKGIFRKMQFPAAKNGSSTTPTIGLPFGRL